ncbi:MAG: protein kinase [Planctomycetes bacterium]|nr:protein kinase [Planctomycetota bacterium]
MAAPHPPDREAEILALLRQALDRMESGHPVDLEELCRGRPDLAAPVAEALQLHGGLRGLTRRAQRVDPRTGTLLAGRYRLGARLGQGAMGVVYEAEDQELRRPVAVKLFSPALLGDAVAEQRFLREAEILASLHHPHVVTVFDRGHDGDQLFLVTELLVGAPLAALADVLREGPAAWPAALRELPPPEASPLRLAVRWCAELAAGLGAAHAAGVYHRDVKPGNVFVCRDHRAVLLDFGIAARHGEATLTAASTTLGTPFYMAPEQAGGRERRAASVDVYGLCATLYHLLAGRPPYVGDAAAVLARLQREDPAPLRRLRPDLPRDLCAIVERGMERDPARRYATCAGLEADLRAFLEHRPVVARPIGRLGRAARRVRRAPAASAAVALAVLAVLLLVVVVPLHRAWQAQRVRVAVADLDARIPPLLGFEGTAAQRARIPAEEQAQHLELLDRILALDPAHGLARILRGAVHADRGAGPLAAGDTAALAADPPDPFLAALSTRLASRPSPGGVAGLPEPASLPARCAAAAVLLRERGEGFAAAALRLLEPVRDAPLAREVRIVALLAHGERGGGTPAFEEVLDEVRTLRARHGNDTARWLAAEGTALLVLRRHQEAVAPLAAADRLAPGRHGTLTNLGVAYRRMNRLDDARRVLEAAARIRPWQTNTTVTLAQVHADAGRFADALAVAAALPDSGDEARQRFDLVGTLLLRRALQEFQDSERGVAVATAAEALGLLERALEVPGPGRARIALRAEIARALRDGTRSLATARFLDFLREDPANPYQIANLATVLPDAALDAEGTTALRTYLRALAETLAPGDAAFRERQARLRSTERR